MRFAPPPPHRAASAVRATLLAQVSALTALVVFEAVRGRDLAREIAALPGDPASPQAQAVAGAVTVFAVLVLLTVAATAAAAAAYAVWLTRAARANAPAARMAGAVAATWLLPPVNLVAPPLLLDRIWRGANPEGHGRRRWLALLTAWWLTSLIALALVVLRLPPLGVPGLSGQGITGLGPAALVAVVIAARLCAATVQEITRLQSRPRARGRTRPWSRLLHRHATRPAPAGGAAPERSSLRPTGVGGE
ncbi:hypothetical protein HNP84_006125 [Thermocatellispora tengchongensis]|uniref:DUF4328 domain-containing protein n=1 Tax=Thermocatellispora tengchongensis TaxID=1073253 RepID=A0A840P9P7_9ACTN|nr:DUF4328 domain-containing protein [Thermocatellispora tengchongensis]MBB5136378.1 hypothetical protein [Thermocatellispora tengchongensis]